MNRLLRVREEPEYIPRLTADGIRGNPYWYLRNPFYQAGYGMPNCTCYAWGRFWENADVDRDFSNRPNLCTLNAEYWFDYNDGYERGNTPTLGAVLCLADGPYSGEGHVAIVEVINQDGSIVVSESNWNGLFFDTPTYYPPNYLKAPGYVFQGFIYNPHSGGGGWVYKKKPWLWKRELYNREEFLLK